MHARWSIFLAAFCSHAWGAEIGSDCRPTAEIQAELDKAADVSASVTDPFGALAKAAPFLEVRDRHPDNLFAHQRYQDAIHDNGIEGHLRLLEKQYNELESRHPADPMYRFLSLRAVTGRRTSQVIQGLNELVADHPGFAPAHRTLAEIFGTASFRDSDKQSSERAAFLSICPSGDFTPRPPPIPDRSPLIDRAQHLLAGDGPPDQVVALTVQGLKEFVWRSQRIRAFDWFSREEKLQSISEVQARYWQAWPIQVRALRKAGRTSEANQLLTLMAQRAIGLRNQPGSMYGDALDSMVRLYAEARQFSDAAASLAELRRVHDQHPDQLRTLQLEVLQKLITPGLASAP